MISSKSVNVWLRIESSAAFKNRSPLYTNSPTLTSGVEYIGFGLPVTVGGLSSCSISVSHPSLSVNSMICTRQTCVLRLLRVMARTDGRSQSLQIPPREPAPIANVLSYAPTAAPPVASIPILDQN